MAVCKFCGEEVPHKEMFRHWNEQHPEEVREMRSRGGKSKAGAGKDTGKGAATQPGQKTKTTPNLVEAAMLEFVGQTIVVPNTPALIYGYFCAKKYGFEGSVGEFLQEVIDDFYQARGINYYEEVQQGWQGIGKEISQEEQEEQPELVAERA